MIYLCMQKSYVCQSLSEIFQDCDWPQDAEFSVRHFAKEWGGIFFCLRGMWHASKSKHGGTTTACYKLQNGAIVSFYMTFR